MEKEYGSLKEEKEILEKVGEGLMDALSLVILLENDMETQKADCIHLRIVKMVHDRIKGIQKSLSEGSQTE